MEPNFAICDRNIAGKRGKAKRAFEIAVVIAKPVSIGRGARRVATPPRS